MAINKNVINFSTAEEKTSIQLPTREKFMIEGMICA